MTNTKKILIGKVYANWCGHCISLKPEWQNMKKYIKNHFKHIKFIEAESTEINKIKYLKQKHNIDPKGYPTIFKIHETGQIEYYNGPRFTKELTEWATDGVKYTGGRKSRKNKKPCTFSRKNRSSRRTI